MDVIWKFICDNYHAIIELVLLLSVFFVTVFKKKVKVIDCFEAVLIALPDFIVEAEAKYVDGPSKFGYVFNRCIELLVSITHKDKTKLLEEYTPLINAAIESILTTPQKKER